MAVLNDAVAGHTGLLRTTGLKAYPSATLSTCLVPLGRETALCIAVHPTPTPSPNGNLILVGTTGGTRS